MACYPPAMLELTKVSEVATKAASAILTGQTGVRSVVSEPAVDSEGHDALNITIGETMRRRHVALFVSQRSWQ